MYSALTRLQNVFGFFTTVAFFVGALTALSVFLHPGRPSAEVSVSNVQVYV
jgi:signal peptidase complex subunit 3